MDEREIAHPEFAAQASMRERRATRVTFRDRGGVASGIWDIQRGKRIYKDCRGVIRLGELPRISWPELSHPPQVEPISGSARVLAVVQVA